MCVYARARPSKRVRIHRQIINVRQERKEARIFPPTADGKKSLKSLFLYEEKISAKDPSEEMSKREMSDAQNPRSASE